MTALPIVTRELRVASRRGSTYWLRTGAALAVIVIGTWLFLMMQRRPSAEVAEILFGLLTGIAVLYCLLSGVRSTADCISQEKRDGTFGLLFLTDLKGYDVVLGKLVANSLGALYGVLAVVPMLAIPLLMGGVALAEFGRMALVAINTLFFSLALGIGISAMSRSGRKAVGMTFLILLTLTALLPALGAWTAYLTRARGLHPLFLLPSAGFAYYLAFESPYRLGPDKFWYSLGLLHGLGWLCLVAASVIAPRAWQDRPAGAVRLRWRDRWQAWSLGNTAERRSFRKRLLDANAFFWLAARVRLKPALVWTVLALLGGVWVWGIAKYKRDWFNEGIYLTTGLVLNLLIKGWFSSEAGRQLAEDRKEGALELLLSTSLTVRDILRGQFMALARQFLGPVLAVLLVGCLFIFAALTDTGMEDNRTVWIWFWSQGMLMLILDLAAIFWVGMWQALVAKNPNRAASATLVRIIVFPALSFALVMLLTALTSIRGGGDPTWKFFLGWWFALGLTADIIFGFWARRKLRTEFRVAAAQRYSRRAGFWKRLMAADGSESKSDG
jgi:ABC-type Na+ efflux pump permease subunit